MQATRKAEIETLLAQITPGEWHASAVDYEDSRWEVEAYSMDGVDLIAKADASWQPNVRRNLTFIAAAPGMMRELLAEVERLNVELGTVQSMFQALTGETFPVEQLWDDLENEDD